jgi:quercetin dioxygenase-like cupin family protein
MDMARRVIVNPVSGERIVIQTSDGELLSFDLFLPPGGHVPARHTHPNQTEQFTMVSGRMRFSLRRRTILVGPGERVAVPPGTPHWFGNPGPGEAHARVEVRPALRMEELLEASGAMAVGAGLFGTRLPRPAALARFLLDFQREIAVPGLPPLLMRVVLSWFAGRRAEAAR